MNPKEVHRMNKKLLLPLLLTSTMVFADSWLHIKVDNTEGDKEHVRVNVPLSLAEKVLPAIQVNKIHQGKLQIGHENASVDPRMLVEAVRSTADGVFVTVDSDRQKVRVAKEGGYLVVNVRPGPHPEGKDADKDDKNADKDAKDTHKRHHMDRSTENVDVRLPMDVVEALLSGNRDELDLLAAIKALSAHKDLALVTVNDKSQTVRIWIDGKNTAE
jgi:hypothetical protein